MEKEKRRDLRISVSGPYTVRFLISKANKIFSLQRKKVAHARNLSVGGMFIELPALKEKQMQRIIAGKDKLILELETPGSKTPICIKGKITRLEKRDKFGKPVYVAGLSFEGIKEKDREEVLRQLVNICLKSGCRIAD